MDANFLEFFGQMLIQTAKGQRQMDQFGQWMQQGLRITSMPEFNDYFNQIYGLNDITKESGQYTKLIQKAQADFLTAYGEFTGLLGLVPEKKYEALQQEYDALEKKCRAQEKMIDRLTGKMEKSDDPAVDLTDQLTALIEKQKASLPKPFNLSASYLIRTKRFNDPGLATHTLQQRIGTFKEFIHIFFEIIAALSTYSNPLFHPAIVRFGDKRNPVHFSITPH